MAANPKGRAIAGTLGKRFVNQIWELSSRGSAPLPSVAAAAQRRGVHASTYDKNIDDQVRPIVVPDHVIDVRSDKYWGPHPKTGVFGPADDHERVHDQQDGTSGAASAGNGSSALDQTVWFRPLEDVDKPPYA